MKRLKLFSIFIGILLFSAVSFSTLAGAQSFRTGDNVDVAKGEVVNQTLFMAGTDITIDGEVFGDVFCAGETITINGDIHGDVLCAGRSINIKGTVDGDVRVAGQTIDQSSRVSGNVTVAGQTYRLEDSGSIGQDLIMGASKATLNGKVDRDVALDGQNLLIAGRVGRNVKGNIENLRVASIGNIVGDIDFTSPNELSKDEGAMIGGQVIHNQPQAKGRHFGVFGTSIGFLIYLFLAMLLTALVLIGLIPRAIQSSVGIALDKPFRTFLYGLLASFVIPIAIILLLISVFGIPLAILLTLLWIVIIMLSGPFTGYYLGKVLLPDTHKPAVVMLIGSSILLALYFIPVVSFFALLFAYWLGLGMIITDLFNRLRAQTPVVATTKTSKKSLKK